MSKTVIVRADDGAETDVTNAVQILWDGVISSLDWGSGWWDAEDAGAVAWIGQLMEYEAPSKPGGYKLEAWSPKSFAEAIAAYERARATIDANLPELP